MTHESENTNRAKLRRNLQEHIEDSCVSTYSERVEADFDGLLDAVLKETLRRYSASPKAHEFASALQAAFRSHLESHVMAENHLRDIAKHASLKMMERARFDLLHGFVLDAVNGYIQCSDSDKERGLAILNDIDLDGDGRPDGLGRGV